MAEDVEEDKTNIPVFTMVHEISTHLTSVFQDSIKAKALKVLGQFFACHANRFCKADLLEKLLNSILPLLLDPQKQVSAVEALINNFEKQIQFN